MSKNCNCTDITASSCVSWQGDTDDDLKICLDDSLTYVGNIILAKIKDLLKGRGIILTDLTLSDCDYISLLLGANEKNLLNVLDVYKKAICQLKTGVDANAASLTQFTNVSLYTLGCLASADPCSQPLTFKGLIQQIITKICALNTQLSAIGTSLLAIVNEAAGNFLLAGAVTSSGGNGYKTSGIGASAKVIFEALVPPSCPIIYTGAASNFDTAGKGLPNTAYQGWYLCNGANGTPSSTSLPQNAGNNIKYIVRFN